MASEAIAQLAAIEAAEAERKRREDEAALALEFQEQEQREATSPDALLRQMIKAGGRRTSVAPSLIREAEQHRFLDQDAREKLDRRGAALKIPGPTIAERAAEMSTPLGRFATEPDEVRQAELRTNPRGRMADAERVLAELQGGGRVSRETSPIFTDAPMTTGRGEGTMPYVGALKGLEGAEVPRASIRQEFGGTAPDTALSFSDAQGRRPGMRQYDAPPERDDMTPVPEDVGAFGGGLGTVTGGGGATGRARDALIAELQGIAAEAKAQPLTPQEAAGTILREEPLWDEKAAELGPDEIQRALLGAVAERKLDPAVAQKLGRRYVDVARSVAEKRSGFVSPERFAERLRESRRPAPGEAETLAKDPGPIPGAVAAERQAVQDAATPIPGGPGERQSPALAAETEPAGPGDQDPRDALLRGLQGPQNLVAAGGRGESGVEGLLADLGAFREGEGRAGYGESGTAGLMKDLVAFYGPRLPQDIVEALLGRGVVGGGRRLGGEALKSRAIQNALGRF